MDKEFGALREDIFLENKPRSRFLKIKRIIRKLFFWRDPKYIKRQVNSILLKAQKSGLLDSSSREMIGKILKFTHILVREVMVPRTEIIAVNIEEDIDKIIAEVIGTRHTRLPVYRETIDDVIGILNVKDVLEFWAKTIAKEDILAILSTPYYIPETKNAHLLFYELRENKKHMAVVIDEYGGTAGLVTLEDLLEEIVGDLHDGDEMISGNSEIIQSPDGSLFLRVEWKLKKLKNTSRLALGKGVTRH